MAPLGRAAEWQTRWLQVPVSVRMWGFKSPLAHWKPLRERGRSRVWGTVRRSVRLTTGRALPAVTVDVARVTCADGSGHGGPIGCWQGATMEIPNTALQLRSLVGADGTLRLSLEHVDVP